MTKKKTFVFQNSQKKFRGQISMKIVHVLTGLSITDKQMHKACSPFSYIMKDKVSPLLSKTIGLKNNETKKLC